MCPAAALGRKEVGMSQPGPWLLRPSVEHSLTRTRSGGGGEEKKEGDKKEYLSLPQEKFRYLSRFTLFFFFFSFCC